MKRRAFCQVAGLATGSLLFPSFLTRVALGDGTISFRLQVASAPDFAAASLVVDRSELVEPAFTLQELPAGRTYYWRANATDGLETSEWSEVFDFSTSAATDAETSEQPYTFELGANYPNPFNPVTTIPFTLPEAGYASLRVYNQLGQQVAQLVDEYRAAGAYEAVWNAGDLASGTYFCVLKTGAHTQTRQMVLVK